VNIVIGRHTLTSWSYSKCSAKRSITLSWMAPKVLQTQAIRVGMMNARRRLTKSCKRSNDSVNKFGYVSLWIYLLSHWLIVCLTQGILTKGKYYTAIGLVTEAALSRILQDILALSDIPEVDSHQLSELCRILNSLEGLFHEDITQTSVAVAYVPSWLKFNYLSELLVCGFCNVLKRI
jgi:hypothetical protein